jgi:hypothetical protein
MTRITRDQADEGVQQWYSCNDYYELFNTWAAGIVHSTEYNRSLPTWYMVVSVLYTPYPSLLSCYCPHHYGLQRPRYSLTRLVILGN